MIEEKQLLLCYKHKNGMEFEQKISLEYAYSEEFFNTIRNMKRKLGFYSFHRKKLDGTLISVIYT